MEGGDPLRRHLAMLRCSECGRAYADAHARIRAEREAISFVDLICRGCGGQASAIATIVEESGSRTRVELGDLDEASAGAIEIDDVLEMGRFLREFDGDVRRLFEADDGRSPSPA